MGKYLRSFRGVALCLVLFSLAVFVASITTSRTEAGTEPALLVDVSNEAAGIESVAQQRTQSNENENENEDTPQGVALVVDRTDDSAAASACTAAANDCSLRGAVASSNVTAGNNIINFDPAIFGASQTITLGGTELVINNNGSLTVNGPGANLLTVSGNNASRIISNSVGAVTTISGIRFTAGNGVGAANTGRAGAVYNNGGNLTLNSVVITGNTAANGGGLNNATAGAILTLNNCVVSNNTSTSSGGGMQNFSTSTLNIINSEVSGNTGGSTTGGGGIQGNGTVRVINSTIANNTANAGNGGGLVYNGGTGNSLTVTNSTFSGNTAVLSGGGVLRTGTTSTVAIGNSIFAGNTNTGGLTPDASGTFTSQGTNIVGNGSGAVGFTGPGDQVGTAGTPINPQLGPLTNNGGTSRTFALLAASPARNAGNNAIALDLGGSPLTTDQRGAGFPRVVGGTVDIGAFEAAPAGPPQYQIIDIGVVVAGDTASQGFGVSTGGVAVGRSFRTGGTQAFSWTQGGGIVGLPNLAGRTFAVSNAANDSGRAVGTGATTAFGSGRLPIVWQNGAVSQLPLPAGETLGDANDVNSAGVAVGSVNAGSTQRAVIYNGANATVITQTTVGGSFFNTAYGINDSGRVVGTGIDPGNAARNVGMVYDIGNANAIEVGALPGSNGALAFGVSNSGFVTGSSMMNQGSGLPFIWSQAGGIQPVALPVGTTQGSGRAVNSAGWVVGTASSAFAIPFLNTGTTTYRLGDLIPPGTGWDLLTNTSSSALGISDNGIIVGTGVLNGAVRAYAMVPGGSTPTPTPTATPTSTPTNTPTATPTPTPTNLVQFSAASYINDESTVGDVPQQTVVTVTRTGVTTGVTTVTAGPGATGTANVAAT
ncbi:MAG: hypothetical protein KBF83_02255, partial [Pyrinomonadaceae bacterium]|nr:hypothetical protein [Pyrinomonadaceae bacterium]